MIRCLAIDDEPLARKKMASYIEKTPFLELVDTCESALQALELMQKQQIDLLFLDINMPDLSGMDFAKSLDQAPGIIFTTAYSEYALDGFKVDAIDYLLKPIDYPDFLKAAQKAQKTLSKPENHSEELSLKEEFLFIKSEHKIIKIELADIKYLESMREYVKIHLVNRSSIMTLISLKKIEESLPSNNFMRVHRSFIVNLKRISIIERNRIVFDEKIYIPISEAYRESFRAYVDQYFL